MIQGTRSPFTSTKYVQIGNALGGSHGIETSA